MGGGGQPAGNFGNGMEWNVGLGNTESGDIGGGSAGQRFEKKMTRKNEKKGGGKGGMKGISSSIRRR